VYKEYAANIHESGSHLLKLINEILDLSRIEAGRYELNEQWLRLVDIVDECHRLLKLRAESKGQHVIEVLDESLPQVWADERAMRQICLNLLSNALKFTPRGGQIVLTVGMAEDGGQFISVRDTGPGIPKDEIPKVLQAFGQGSLALQSAEGGTGLGLSIVQSLIDLHDGSLEINSALRKGTEAVIRLPRKRVMQPAGTLPLREALESSPGPVTHRSSRPPRLRRPIAGTEAAAVAG
jgi:two-component system cell cycle sensor histidine kinase PleC